MALIGANAFVDVLSGMGVRGTYALQDPNKLAKFKSDMGDRLRVATENGATYELIK